VARLLDQDPVSIFESTKLLFVERLTFIDLAEVFQDFDAFGHCTNSVLVPVHDLETGD
jgi:hypothetical protein